MTKLKSMSAMVSYTYFAILFTTGSAFAEADCLSGNCAKNRLDSVSVMDQLSSNWVDTESEIWINQPRSAQSVNIGDKVYYSMKSNRSVHYQMILVDPKGSVTVVKPTGADGQVGGASDSLVFPPLASNCSVYENNSECFVAGNTIEQEGPIGKESVYLIASQNAISNDDLMIPAGSDFEVLGRDLSKLNQVLDNLSDEKIDVIYYSYDVDSNETEYKTRALRRKVQVLEKQAVEQPEQEQKEALVFNNIEFDYNSAVLTKSSIVELDGLGSVLIERMGAGELPVVSLVGHTDSRGSAEYNYDLSVKRASSVKDYLVAEFGLPGEDIYVDGQGEYYPLDSNKTEDGRSANRRVEFSVVGQ